MLTPLTSLLLLLPNDPPLEGPAPGSPVVHQLGSLIPVLALEPGSIPTGDARGFTCIPEGSAQIQVTQKGQLSALHWGPRSGVGLVLGDSRLTHKTRVKEDEAPSCQVEHQEGKETYRFPAEVPLEFEPELGHSGIIPDWIVSAPLGAEGCDPGREWRQGSASQASLRDGAPGGLQA